MYFFAIVKGCLSDKPVIDCGDISLVDVDGRYSLENQYGIAYDCFVARGIDMIGIACFRDLHDDKHCSSVATHDLGGLNFSSFCAFRGYTFF
jgi:hypothetical protein